MLTRRLAVLLVRVVPAVVVPVTAPLRQNAPSVVRTCELIRAVQLWQTTNKATWRMLNGHVPRGRDMVLSEHIRRGRDMVLSEHIPRQHSTALRGHMPRERRTYSCTLDNF